MFDFQISSPDIKLERDIFLYLAYIAQKKFKIVIDEVNDRSPIELQALKLLAEFMLSPNRRFDPDFSFSILLIYEIPSLKCSTWCRGSTLDKFVEKFGSSDIENHYVIYVGATMYFFDKQTEKALQLLHLDDHLES